MKTIILSAISTLFLGGIGSTAFASGFQCESTDGYNVRLFNYVHAESGTRTPAVLVISHGEEGTLLVRKGEEIRKHTRVNTVQYVVEGSRKLDADVAILQISFREGAEVLEADESVGGQLILDKDGAKAVSELTCTRYLKQ